MNEEPKDALQTARELLEQGVAASRANDSERALALFTQAAATAPGWPMPHLLTGSEYAGRKDWIKAEEHIARAVLLDPKLRLARYQLGLLQYSCGRVAAGLVTWEPLVAQNADALSHFVRGFAALAQDDFAAARREFEAGLARNDCEPAVANDVRKVLARMPVQAAAPAPGDASEPSSHVLVANYGQFTLH